MKLITLWSIIIKIIGVYYAFAFVQLGLFLLSFIFNVFGSGFSGDLLSTILSVFVEGIIAFMCLFRTKEIIQIFKLESTIEEKEVNVNLNESNVVRLSIAIIGLYSLSQSIPEMIGILLSKVASAGMLLTAIFKVALGLFMVLKTKELEQRISNYKSK